MKIATAQHAKLTPIDKNGAEKPIRIRSYVSAASCGGRVVGLGLGEALSIPVSALPPI